MGGYVLDVPKAIDKLDDLTQSLLRMQSQRTVWQRTLIEQLKQLDRDIQVHRMLISMERDRVEITRSAGTLYDRLALAAAQIEKSRADSTTRSAMRLAKELASQVREDFDAFAVVSRDQF